MIIESGLDIPNVNTIIINHADKFGLAQLYQLRGRVGRSSVQAYAYLVVKGFTGLDEAALKRLQTIAQHTELGSGIKIAMRDLEIRGAGNILGKEQSGFINSIGFELYNKILDQAVHEIWNEEGIQGVSLLKRGIEPGEVRVKTNLDAFFPEDYLPDPAERVNIYRRLTDFKSTSEVDELKQELEDRFGKLPQPAQNLMDLMVLKILACNLGVVSLTLREHLLRLSFFTQNDTDQLPETLSLFLNAVQYKLHVFQEKELGLEIQLPDKDKTDGILPLIRQLFETVKESTETDDIKTQT